MASPTPSLASLEKHIINPSRSQPHTYPVNLTIPQFLLDSASHPLRPSRLPASEWLIDDETGRAYGLEEIRERVERVARAVKDRWSVGEGDVVCLYSANCIDYPIVIWALHRLGATVSCANPSYTSSELCYQLTATKARLLFTSSASLPTALDAAAKAGLFGKERVVVFSPPPPLPKKSGDGCFMPTRPPAPHSHAGHSYPTVDLLANHGWFLPPNYHEPRGPLVGNNIAFLSFSSGTTGLPKAIAIAHRNLIANVLQMAHFNRANEPGLEGKGGERFAKVGDRALGVLPMYHIYGLVVNLHHALFTGMAVVVIPKFTFQGVLESIVRHRITHLYIVPPMVVMMINNPLTKKYDLSHVRFAMVGAAPLSKEVTERFKKLIPGMRAGQGYGMTETCTTVCQFDFQTPSVSGSAGILLPSTQALLITSSGAPAAANEPGELWVRGPQMALGYAGNEQATRETFLAGGWVRTGDEARVDGEGNLWIVDRLKEFLKVNGFQVAPAELEGHLVLHPYVTDAGVVGIPDDLRGEVPIAFVVLSEEGKRVAAAGGEKGLDSVKEEVKGWIKKEKVRYKWLEGGVEVVEAVPKNPSGKILRRLLREEAKKVVEARKKGMTIMAKL